MVSRTRQSGVVKKQTRSSYSGFAQINGKHPLRQAVPNGYVDYAVRNRRGGNVFYFNFALAKQMGLVRQDHSEKLNKELCDIILETFSLEIINEYDNLNNIKTPEKDIRRNKYMATRYLQAQHPDKTGRSSGDGRSIWNGIFVDKRKKQTTTWDISSCGTGATCLSPATAIEKQFFKTGDNHVSYGGGRSDLLDGVSAALMSDIFYKNNILTERTLCVIDFPDGTSVNVRASKNLLRPAHIFCHLKQADYDALKSSVDYYIDRQVANGDWPEQQNTKARYKYFLDRVATYFARAAAKFESEYIFCWMDWDGDNILIDGGLIDFGSVRQFGLYHSEYRYDDEDRYSTTISEQKNKAKYIVQTFSQITDFLITGKKRPIAEFANDRVLRMFQAIYDRSKMESFLYRIGFNTNQIFSLLNNKNNIKLINSFQKTCFYFENSKSVRGSYKVQDGITWDAIFSLRDILREYPEYLKGVEHTQHAEKEMCAKQFMGIIKSAYVMKVDLELTPGRKRRIRMFQNLYVSLVDKVAALTDSDRLSVLDQISSRSGMINRYERVTGDSVLYIADKLISIRKKVSRNDINKIMAAFIEEHVLYPEYYDAGVAGRKFSLSHQTNKVLEALNKIVEDCRDGI